VTCVTNKGTRWRSWLKQYATSRNVTGSIPYLHNPSGRPMALWLANTLTEMSTEEYFLGSKGGRCVQLTNLPISCADYLEIWEAELPGTLSTCPGMQWDCFTFTVINKIRIYMWNSPCNTNSAYWERASISLLLWKMMLFGLRVNMWLSSTSRKAGPIILQFRIPNDWS
jgi:hypothetical protein